MVILMVTLMDTMVTRQWVWLSDLAGAGVGADTVDGMGVMVAVGMAVEDFMGAAVFTGAVDFIADAAAAAFHKSNLAGGG